MRCPEGYRDLMPKTPARPATMNVHVGPHFRKLTDDLVRSGRYGSASEVVRTAFRLLEQAEREHEHTIAAIQVGLDDVAASRVRPLGRFRKAFERRNKIPRKR